MNFKRDYARLYDAFYSDKNYKHEAQYVANIIKTHAPKNILELGCGSGKYTREFAKMGFEIKGLDISREMLEIAKHENPNIDFICADMSDFSLESQTFNCAISLFGCVSYLTNNAALLAAFNNIAKTLKNGGIFIFDVWYGVAVLEQKPQSRLKRATLNGTTFTRKAEPILKTQENLVEVHYEITAHGANPARFCEVHKMRYFFIPEIELLAQVCGFKLIKAEAFLSGEELDFRHWNALFVLEKCK